MNSRARDFNGRTAISVRGGTRVHGSTRHTHGTASEHTTKKTSEATEASYRVGSETERESAGERSGCSARRSTMTAPTYPAGSVNPSRAPTHGSIKLPVASGVCAPAPPLARLGGGEPGERRRAGRKNKTHRQALLPPRSTIGETSGGGCHRQSGSYMRMRPE